MTLTRRYGRPRLHRSVRRNGRVTSEYVASGAVAELMAEADRLERANGAELRRLARAERHEQVREERRREEAVAGVVAQAIDLAREVLEAAGYRQHHRGEY